jgi:hypothetical protein
MAQPLAFARNRLAWAAAVYAEEAPSDGGSDHALCGALVPGSDQGHRNSGLPGDVAEKVSRYLVEKHATYHAVMATKQLKDMPGSPP